MAFSTPENDSQHHWLGDAKKASLGLVHPVHDDVADALARGRRSGIGSRAGIDCFQTNHSGVNIIHPAFAPLFDPTHHRRLLAARLVDPLMAIARAAAVTPESASRRRDQVMMARTTVCR